jgi:hypothetical protein
MCDDSPDQPDHCACTDIFADFEKELSELINKHSLENSLEMPDFMMAELLVNMLKAMRLARKLNDGWHGMNAYPDDYKELKKSVETFTTKNNWGEL